MKVLPDIMKQSWVSPVYAERRYEVQGEYVIPPDTRIPDSAASLAPKELMGSRSGAPLKPPKSAFEQATGRWRLQVRSDSLLPPVISHMSTWNSLTSLPCSYERSSSNASGPTWIHHNVRKKERKVQCMPLGVMTGASVPRSSPRTDS